MPVAPATIVRTKRSWPGTSTTDRRRRRRGRASRSRARSRCRARRSSSSRSVSVPVSASTSAVLPWSMWPAVPSVSARQPRAAPARRRRGRPRARRRRRASVRGVEQQATASTRRPPAAREPARSAACSAAARVGHGAAALAGAQRRQRSAADAGLRRRRPRRPTPPPAARRARGRRSGGSCAIRSTGSAAPGTRRVAMQAQRRLERGERQLVDAHARGPAGGGGTRSIASRVPARSPACGPPSSLSPREADQRRAGGDRAARRRARRRAPGRGRAARSRGRRPPAAPCSRADRHELRQRHVLGEADDAVVGRVHAQEQRGLRADRALVVGRRVRFVVPTSTRRAPRRGEDLRDPEAVADLDQLAARDDDLAAARRARSRRAPARRRCWPPRARPRRPSAPRSAAPRRPDATRARPSPGRSRGSRSRRPR